MTRVTAIEPSGNLYGSEYCLLDIIRGTSPRFEWDVVLPAGPFDELLSRNGIPHRALLPRDSHTVSLARKLGSYWRLREHLVERQPAVVYVNQAGMLRAVNALTRGLRTEIVCQVQTLEDARFIATHPSEHTRVRAFICNSRFTAAAAGLPPEKLCVFYQPLIVKSLEHRTSEPSDPHQWRVAILGRVAKSKGHFVFLEAAEKLIAGGRRDVRFVVIGEGLTPDITEEFAIAVKERGVAEYFELRGYRPQPHDELASCDVVAIPSLAEPLGRVLLDAAATGKPAILSDAGGLGEFSRHFDIGHRVLAGDAQALADGISRVLDSYRAQAEAFTRQSAEIFRRLEPSSYFSSLTDVIENAARGRSSAVKWFGIQ